MTLRKAKLNLNFLLSLTLLVSYFHMPLLFLLHGGFKQLERKMFCFNAIVISSTRPSSNSNTGGCLWCFAKEL